MARLLPIDLVNASFSKASFGGYKHDEVNDLVDRAAQALEELAAENDDLRSQVLRLRSDLDQMRGEERLVKDAIVSAQRASELLRADAMREADLIREEARQGARAERSQAQKDAETLRDEVERLQTMRKRFAAEQRAILEKALRDLDEIAPIAASSAPTPPPIPMATVAPAPPAPVLTETVAAFSPPPAPEAPVQGYPTRLPRDAKPLEPVIVEDADGEQWVR